MIWGGWTLTPIPQPKLAVDVFMILSGYLMVHQWYAKGEEDAGVSLHTVARFYVRRIFRIAPVYYLVLLLVFLIGSRFLHGYDVLRNVSDLDWTRNTYYDPLGKHLGLRNLFMHVTFVFGLLPNWSFSDFLPDWSISLEMQFYAVFPLMLLAFRRITPFVTAVICVAVGVTWGWYGIEFPEPSFLPIKLHIFLAGMLLAEAVRRLEGLGWSGWVLAGVGMLIPGWFASPVVTLAAVLVFFLSVGNGWALPTVVGRIRFALKFLLGNRLMQFLADTSYGVYLLHGLFISLVGGNLLFRSPRILSLGADARVSLLIASTLICTYITAWGVHYLVERPGIALGRTAVRRIPTSRTSSKNAQFRTMTIPSNQDATH